MIELLLNQSISAWEYAQSFPRVFLATMLIGVVCPVIGTFLLMRRLILLAIALPQFAMAGLACGVFLMPALLPILPIFQEAREIDEKVSKPPAEIEELRGELQDLIGEAPASEQPPSPAQAPGPPWVGHEAFHANPLYEFFWAFSFTTLAIVVLVWLAGRGLAITPEALVGAAFAVASAATLLFVSESAFGRDHVEHIVRGDLVEIARSEFPLFVASFLIVGAVLLVYRRRMLLVSYDPETARTLGLRVGRWNFLFYSLVGLMISIGVLCVGPVVLFGLLVLPPLAARLFARTMWAQLNLSVALGLLSTLIGFAIAVPGDLVLGPTIVVVAGACVLLAWLLRWLLPGSSR